MRLVDQLITVRGLHPLSVPRHLGTRTGSSLTPSQIPPPTPTDLLKPLAQTFQALTVLVLARIFSPDPRIALSSSTLLEPETTQGWGLDAGTEGQGSVLIFSEPSMPLGALAFISLTQTSASEVASSVQGGAMVQKESILVLGSHPSMGHQPFESWRMLCPLWTHSPCHPCQAKYYPCPLDQSFLQPQHWDRGYKGLRSN